MTDDNKYSNLKLSNDNLVVKKKRGRKPKSYYAELEKQGILPSILKENKIKEPKKRGRKPILKKEEEKKEPKKRGRKPKKRNFNIVEFVKVKFDEEDEDIILHIPIKIKQSIKVKSKSNIIPTPYEENNLYHNLNDDELNNGELNNGELNNNNELYIGELYNGELYNGELYNGELNIGELNNDELNNGNELNNSKITNGNELNNGKLTNGNELNNNYLNNQYNNIIKHDNNCKNKVNQILIPFKNSNKIGVWPERINIYCWHCCHPFKNKPVSIPMYIKKSTFYVYGVFCSYNCGAAYNLNSNDSNKTIKHELLCHMYNILFKDKNFIDICPAPPKEILQIFGGNVTIDNYRNNFLKNNKEFKILKPPLISIIPQVEETIKQYRKINNKFIPINDNYFKINSGLTSTSTLNLKRDKPISNKNTLDKCMGIKSYCS